VTQLDVDLDALQRVARATCAQMHKAALESGYLVRPRRDPGQYRSREVWPVLFAALAADIIREAKP
jgi:hypothetical protein